MVCRVMNWKNGNPAGRAEVAHAVPPTNYDNPATHGFVE